MSDHLRLHDEGDEQVTRGLRQLYAAPKGDAYWRDLEARILSRLTEPETIAWWDELDRWVRPALVAAATSAGRTQRSSSSHQAIASGSVSRERIRAWRSRQ